MNMNEIKIDQNIIIISNKIVVLGIVQLRGRAIFTVSKLLKSFWLIVTECKVNH